MVQKAFVYSRKGNNTDAAAKEWRSELAYRVLLLLRTTVSNIEYPSVRVPAYEIPELSGMEWQYVQPDRNFLQRAEIPYSEEINSIRVPNRMAQLVRETICSQLSRLQHPMNVQEELNVLVSVEKFQEAYYGMRKFRVREVFWPTECVDVMKFCVVSSSHAQFFRSPIMVIMYHPRLHRFLSH
jgi:hypothetical protein